MHSAAYQVSMFHHTNVCYPSRKVLHPGQTVLVMSFQTFLKYSNYKIQILNILTPKCIIEVLLIAMINYAYARQRQNRVSPSHALCKGSEGNIERDNTRWSKRWIYPSTCIQYNIITQKQSIGGNMTHTLYGLVYNLPNNYNTIITWNMKMTIYTPIFQISYEWQK